ncbi:hypothetical protein C2E23DRAFT_812729 [Lenzites betulinus]|nr:hypothetical protein C2E23DRAFT_812729 [Lenzites betulinus]
MTSVQYGPCRGQSHSRIYSCLASAPVDPLPKMESRNHEWSRFSVSPSMKGFWALLAAIAHDCELSNGAELMRFAACR